MPTPTPITPTACTPIPVTENVAIIMCGPEDLPPTVHPEMVPAGWQLMEDGETVTDFNIGDLWYEAYWIERTTADE